MGSITKPMMGRTTHRGSEAKEVGTELAYTYRRIIGAWIRERRVAIGMTQEELAAPLGMGHSAISAVELGRSTISPERYEALAALLQVDQKTLALFLLRYTNPWLYKMLFPEKVDKKLTNDLAHIPNRIKSG